MLVLSRKVGEQVCLPQSDIVLTVLEIDGRHVRLGIAAPQEISVVRTEFRDRSPRRPVDAITAVTHAVLSTDEDAPKESPTPCP